MEKHIIKKSRLKEIIREEIQNIDNINEELSRDDYKEIKDMIRAELAAVMFDLFKKKQMWI